MASKTRGTRSLFALAAASATAIVGIVSVSTPAQSVIAGDCATPFPVADLVADQPVSGLTVSRGTTPDAFTGTVLGVLKDGIAPGLDMVMMRLSNPEIDRVGGIWAGMSGSPVYAEDGRLIGAVAYGLAFGPSTVAGVTPFEDMNDYLPTPPPALRVSPSTARTIAAASEVTKAEAAQGFAQLRMPLTVSGGGKSLAVTKKRAYLNRATASGGTASAGVAGPETIVAGGNLALTFSTGDVTLGGVGTATSVCDDKVVGFGHPATFSGKIEGGMNPADAVYIQEDPVFGAFKVANIGDLAGTITDDHLTGITGTFGTGPATFDITSSVTYGARSRTGSSAVSMDDYAPDVTFYELLGNHDRVLDGRIPGSEVNTWTITGSKPNGDPFTIDLSDRYTDSNVVLYSSIWDIPDMVYLLGRIPGVTLDGVTMSSDVTDETGTWKVASADYKLGSSWVKLGSRSVVKAKAGKTLQMRAHLKDELGNTRVVPVSIAIPAKAKGTDGTISVVGGNRDYESYWSANTIDQFLKVAAAHTRNDQVVAALDTYGGKKSSVSTTSGSATQDKVVDGRKRFRIVVS